MPTEMTDPFASHPAGPPAPMAPPPDPPPADPKPASISALHPLAVRLHIVLNRVAECEHSIERLLTNLAAQEAAVALETLEAKGEDGKPRYSNDMVRKAAVEAAQASHPTCQGHRGALALARRELALCQAEASAIRATIRLQAGRQED